MASVSSASIANYKKLHGGVRKQASLVFLIDGNKILLARKKRGFGVDKLNGYGGKMDESDKTIRDTAIREAQEEGHVTPIDLTHVATISYYFWDKPDIGQIVTVYLCRKWEGTPVETEEMAPEWFDITNVPYDRMWVSDIHYLPRLLNGETLEGELLFNTDGSVAEHDFKEIHSGK